MILIYGKYETIGINADRFEANKFGKVKIYCKGDVAFVGKLTPRNEGILLCDELAWGLKSEKTAEFDEIFEEE